MTGEAGAVDVVRYGVDEGVAILTLARAEKRNALNQEVVAALWTRLREADADSQVRVILLNAEGRDFCAGADLAELERIADLGAEASLNDAQGLGDLFVLMRRLEKPIIAAVQGRALAGGCGLATACDLVLAAEDAQFGYPEVHLGFVPAMVMAILRRKVGESRAFELLVRGERLGAPAAEHIGLVAHVFEPGELAAGALAYAKDLAARPASALGLSKRLLYGIDGLAFEAAIDRGAEVNVIARLTDACREGVRTFLARSRG